MYGISGGKHVQTCSHDQNFAR